MSRSRNTYKLSENVAGSIKDKLLENNVQTIRRLDEAKVLHDIVMLKLLAFKMCSSTQELVANVEVLK
jgi:hypothetical protein